MTDIKSAVQNTIKSKTNLNNKELTNISESSETEVLQKKKRVGRPLKLHQKTKIHEILESRGLTRTDLFELIISKYPNEPISPDAISRIVSGRRKYFNTNTLFRICGALNITPNMALSWEKEVK